MVIDYKNKNSIQQKIYVHDAIFNGFNYEYEKNLITFEAVECYYKKKFNFRFCNVFGFEMQACDSWCKGSNIIDWELGDLYGNKLTEKLSHWKVNEKYFGSRLENIDKVVESIITLSSGDTLTIVCEYIDFEECEFIN